MRTAYEIVAGKEPGLKFHFLVIFLIFPCAAISDFYLLVSRWNFRDEFLLSRIDVICALVLLFLFFITEIGLKRYYRYSFFTMLIYWWATVIYNIRDIVYATKFARIRELAAMKLPPYYSRLTLRFFSTATLIISLIFCIVITVYYIKRFKLFDEKLKHRKKKIKYYKIDWRQADYETASSKEVKQRIGARISQLMEDGAEKPPVTPAQNEDKADSGKTN